jgi:RHS repeat-associated protein
VSKNYYDAGDKLRGFNRALGPYGDDDTHPGNRNVFEEYYYDALGRRVLVRSRRTASCSTEITECGSYVARTVWDGDQVVFEIRTPGGTGTASTTMESDNGVYSGYDGNKYGQTAYVHAGGIDQPVVVMRMGYNGSSTPISVHPHQNWRGSFELGTKSDGTLMTITSGSPVIAWAGARTTLDGEIAQPADGPIWFGGLIPGKTDGSGLQYMRNRYYDPKTGRFTQQDPIGLAGGMNLYGFASGDPVNFSDPFGLCPMELTGRPCLGPMDGPLTLRSDGNPRVGQFGMVRDGGQRAHQGVDIHGLRGQAVLAADEGVVARTGYDEGGFGHFVQLAHKNGSGDVVSYTLYGHLGQASGLKQGASVKAGGVIGAIGRSGNLTTEPTHLHFEIRTRLLAGPGTGNRLDPAKYLPITP